LKKWLLQIQIILPIEIPDENIELTKDGGDRIFLGRNKLPGRDKTEYVLHSTSSIDDPMKFLEVRGEKIELILDNLAFQLQAPIPIKYVEVIDITDPVELGEEREIIAANIYPRIQKDTELDFIETWRTSINTRIIKEELDDDIVAALRWFSKGISTKIVVDRFTSFWIALEILTAPTKPREKIFFHCFHCGYDIESCPECSHSTKHFPNAKERIENYLVNELGVERREFLKVWEVRQIFHGRNTLQSEDLQPIIDATVDLKKMLVANLKMKLGATKQDDPFQIREVPMQIGSLFIKGKRKILDTDIENSKKSSHVSNRDT